MVGRKRQKDASNVTQKPKNIRRSIKNMASENYLEEALNAEVDETAVNAIMKSLEFQLSSTSSISNQQEASVALHSNPVTSELEINVTSHIQKCEMINNPYSVVDTSNEDVYKSTSIISLDNNKNSDSSRDVIPVLPASPIDCQSGACISQLISKQGQLDDTTAKPTENIKPIYLTGTQISNCRAMFQPRTLPNNNLSFTLLPQQTVLQTASNDKDVNKPHSQSPTSVMVHVGKMSGVEHMKPDSKTLMIKCSASSNTTPGSPLLMNIVTMPMTTHSSVTLTDTHAGTINSSSGLSVAATIPKTIASTIAAPQMEGNAVNTLTPGVQIVNVIPLKPGTPSKQGQKNVAPRMVIGTPQVMGNRVGYQGKITVQAQQGLSGRPAQGHLLLKNQSGQYQWVRVNLATTRSGATNVTTSMSTAVGQSVIALTKANSSDVPQGTQLPTMPSQNVKIQSISSDIVTKEKCQAFLAKILELANTKTNTVKKSIYNLTQDLIDGKVEVEYFTHYLEILLNSKSQYSFTEFLRKSLPLIRHSLATKKLVLDGIRPPPFPGSAPVAMVSHLSSPGSCPTVIQPAQQSILIQPSVETGSSFKSRELFWQSQTQLQAKVASSNVSNKIQGLTQSHLPDLGNITTQGVSLSNRTYFSQSLIRPQVSAIRTTSPLALQQQASTPMTDLIKIPVSTSMQDIHQLSPSVPPLHVNQTIVPEEPVYELTKTAIPAMSDIIMPTKQISSIHSARSAVKNKRKKQYSFIDFAAEEINDVTSMCGVNLEEESHRIIKSEKVGTQKRSCKDESFLNLEVLQNKVKEIVFKHGLSEPSSQIANLVSQACEENIKNLLEKLSIIAAHRTTKLHLNMQHEILRDVKGQLKFLEEVDQIRQKQQEENECKFDIAGHAKFRGKYKKALRAEMVELRQQEANQTALHAIGFRKKFKLSDESIASTSGFLRNRNLSAISSAEGCLMVRTWPRIKRVTMQDMIFLLEQEKHTCRSVLLYKTYFKR